MKRFLSIAAASLSLVGSMVHASAQPGTTSQPYLPGAGDAIVLECDNNGQNPPDNLGGACFILDGDETSMSVSIADASGLPVGGYYKFTNAGNTVDNGHGSFCSTSPTVQIPLGSEQVIVFVDGPVGGPLDCSGAAGIGTAGTITLRLS